MSRYSKEAVQQQIDYQRSRGDRISKREERMIHALLRGRD